MRKVVQIIACADGKDVVNIYDCFKVLRSRKKERIPFTKRTGELLEKRMDQADGKFD